MVKPPTPVIFDLVAELKLRCRMCGYVTAARHYKAHMASNWRCYYYTELPAEVSVRDLPVGHTSRNSQTTNGKSDRRSSGKDKFNYTSCF